MKFNNLIYLKTTPTHITKCTFKKLKTYKQFYFHLILLRNQFAFYSNRLTYIDIEEYLKLYFDRWLYIKNKEFIKIFNKKKITKKIHQIFINLIFKNGLKIKYILINNLIWKYYYNNFFKFNKNCKYYNYNLMYNLSKIYFLFWKPTFFFNVILDSLNTMFIIKSFAIAKQLRKYTKQKYVIKYLYLPKKKRIRWALKQMIFYSSKFKYTKYNLRLYFCLLLLSLNPTKNFLFSQKVRVYKLIKDKQIKK